MTNQQLCHRQWPVIGNEQRITSFNPFLWWWWWWVYVQVNVLFSFLSPLFVSFLGRRKLFVLTLSIQEWLRMESCKVVPTSESVQEILQCDHSNETSVAALWLSTICFLAVCKMKFRVFVEFSLWPFLGVKGILSPKDSYM